MGASTRSGLEALLRQQWSWDVLALYADELTARGDPRGEVVAMDLIPQPDRSDWWQRRRAVLARWLGEEDAARFGHLVQHGFVHELRDGPLAGRVLTSPLGEFVRGVSTWGTRRAELRQRQLASAPRPWLVRVTVERWDARPFRTPGTTLDLAWILDVIEATPDVNQLYQHYDVLDEPLTVLLPRLAAAGRIALEGPTARRLAVGPARSTTPRIPWPGNDRQKLSAYVGDDHVAELGPIENHIELLARSVLLPLPEPMHRAIARYLRGLVTKSSTPMIVPGQLVPLSAAVHGYLEVQSLAGDCDPRVEDLAAALASPIRDDLALRLHDILWED